MEWGRSAKADCHFYGFGGLPHMWGGSYEECPAVRVGERPREGLIREGRSCHSEVWKPSAECINWFRVEPLIFAVLGTGYIRGGRCIFPPTFRPFISGGVGGRSHQLRVIRTWSTGLYY